MNSSLSFFRFRDQSNDVYAERLKWKKQTLLNKIGI